jgi:hypothetical protein
MEGFVGAFQEPQHAPSRHEEVVQGMILPELLAQVAVRQRIQVLLLGLGEFVVFAELQEFVRLVAVVVEQVLAEHSLK